MSPDRWESVYKCTLLPIVVRVNITKYLLIMLIDQVNQQPNTSTVNNVSKGINKVQHKKQPIYIYFVIYLASTLTEVTFDFQSHLSLIISLSVMPV